MKRHTRPYGCTYPKCHKRFGAKSDWKRHENNQHFQLESYRCQLDAASSKTPCAEVFGRPDLFKKHLENQHLLTALEQIEHEVRSCRIGRNSQGQFWCGFCRKIVKLKEKRNAAWDERFNHIDEHFRREKRIEEWLCMEAKKTKGEVLREMDRTNFDEDGDESFGDEEAESDEVQMVDEAGVEGEQLQSIPDEGADGAVLSGEKRKGKGKKRAASQDVEVEVRGRKRERKGGSGDVVRFCVSFFLFTFPVFLPLFPSPLICRRNISR